MITCAAELGGIAIILHLLTDLPEKLALTCSAFLLCLIVAALRFQWIERILRHCGRHDDSGGGGGSNAASRLERIGTGHVRRDRLQEPTRRHCVTGICRRHLQRDCSWNMRASLLLLGEPSKRIERRAIHPKIHGRELRLSLGAGPTIALLVVGVLVSSRTILFPETLPTAVGGPRRPCKAGASQVLWARDTCLAGAVVETMYVRLSTSVNFRFSLGKNRKLREVPRSPRHGWVRRRGNDPGGDARTAASVR